MKLEIREIASAMVGPREPVIDFQAPSQGEVTSHAESVRLRDELVEMVKIDNTGTNLAAEVASS